MIVLEPITSKNALLFKEIRLRALEDTPLAFSSTYAKESQLSNDEWLKRSERWCDAASIGYLAIDEGYGCGMVACYVENRGVPRGHVISMWVDAAYRRTGVGRMLMDALGEWARARGLCALTLMVTNVNHGAIAFYEQAGFRMSGITEPYPNDPAVVEHEMVLQLGR